MSNVTNENKLGTMKCAPLVLNMSLPIIFSMVAEALYNIVDSIFVSRISEKALSALSLANPLQMIMYAVSIGTMVGVNACVSRSLGEQNVKRANNFATHGIIISLIAYILFMLFGIYGSEFFLRLQTNDEEIIRYGIEYVSICLIFSFGVFFQIAYEKLLQATGKTMYSMCTQLIGAIINVIFDPILIFGLFGFPRLEIRGAAIATVFGQITAAAVGYLFNRLKNKEIKISIKTFKVNIEIIKEIFEIGIPSIIMQSVSSFMIFFFNIILTGFSATAIAVYGVYGRVQSFVFMACFGLNSGVIPIISYNYGAKNRQRIVESLKYAVIFAIIIMSVGTIVFEFIPDRVLHLFDASENMLAIGVPAFRIIGVSFILAGVNIIVSGVFTALNKANLSLIISIVRQIVFLLPLAYIFSKIGGLNLIWFSYPVSETIALIMTLVYYKNLYNDTIKNI